MARDGHFTYLVAVHFSEQASQSASKGISVLLAGYYSKVDATGGCKQSLALTFLQDGGGGFGVSFLLAFGRGTTFVLALSAVTIDNSVLWRGGMFSGVPMLPLISMTRITCVLLILVHHNGRGCGFGLFFLLCRGLRLFGLVLLRGRRLLFGCWGRVLFHRLFRRLSRLFLGRLRFFLGRLGFFLGRLLFSRLGFLLGRLLFSRLGLFLGRFWFLLCGRSLFLLCLCFDFKLCWWLLLRCGRQARGG